MRQGARVSSWRIFRGAWLLKALYLVLLSDLCLVAAPQVEANQAMTDNMQVRTIGILLSSKNKNYREVADALTQELIVTLGDQAPKSEAYLLANLTDIERQRLASSQLIVAVGATATDYASRHFSRVPIVSVFITAQAFATIAAKRGGGAALTALYFDQPYWRYIDLLQVMVPNAKSVATALGPNAASVQRELKRVLDESGRYLNVATLRESTNPMAALDPVMAASDVFLALPATAVFNRRAAKWILHLSYRHKKPVIGFSKSYSDAGAAASIYCSPQNMGEETAQLLSAWVTSDDKAFPQPRHHQLFSVSVNPNVLRLLNLPLLMPAQIMQRMQSVKHRRETSQ